MKTMIRRDVKTLSAIKTYQAAARSARTDEQQKPHEYRRFIPDARPVAHARRGAFWNQIWLNMRLSRAAQSAGAGVAL